MRLGLNWADAATVVVSTVGIYVAFLVFIQIIGQRTMARMSSVDLAVTLALGAVMGRAVLGYTPTLLGGLIGMGTLFGLQAVFRAARRSRRVDRLLRTVPMLLMTDGRVLHEQLRKVHITEAELRQRLRLAGIPRYEDVAAVILERTGEISVLRRGEPIAPELLADVRGREILAVDVVHA